MNYEKIHAFPNDVVCIEKNMLMQLNVLNVVNQGGSMLIMQTERKNRFLVKLYGNFHRFHVSKDCFEVLVVLKI